MLVQGSINPQAPVHNGLNPFLTVYMGEISGNFGPDALSRAVQCLWFVYAARNLAAELMIEASGRGYPWFTVSAAGGCGQSEQPRGHPFRVNEQLKVFGRDSFNRPAHCLGLAGINFIAGGEGHIASLQSR